MFYLLMLFFKWFSFSNSAGGPSSFLYLFLRPRAYVEDGGGAAGQDQVRAGGVETGM